MLAGAFLAAIPSGHAQVVYDFNSTNGNWTGTGDWTWNSSPGAWATGGIGAYITTFTLTSPALTVAVGGTVTGSFTHRFYFENARDGGLFQFSVDGGGWQTVTQELITGQTYNVAMGGSGPITGSMAFSSMSSGWGDGPPTYVTSSFTLGSGSAYSFTAGDQVQIRFLGAWDDSVLRSSPNWEVTAVSVSGVPEPSAYAALAGVIALGFALRRRKQRHVPWGRM